MRPGVFICAAVLALMPPALAFTATPRFQVGDVVSPKWNPAVSGVVVKVDCGVSCYYDIRDGERVVRLSDGMLEPAL